MLTVRRIAARALTGARPAAARAASAVRAVSVAARGFEGAARPAPALFAKFPATQVRAKSVQGVRRERVGPQRCPRGACAVLGGLCGDACGPAHPLAVLGRGGWSLHAPRAQARDGVHRSAWRAGPGEGATSEDRLALTHQRQRAYVRSAPAATNASMRRPNTASRERMQWPDGSRSRADAVD